MYVTVVVVVTSSTVKVVMLWRSYLLAPPRLIPILPDVLVLPKCLLARLILLDVSWLCPITKFMELYCTRMLRMARLVRTRMPDRYHYYCA